MFSGEPTFNDVPMGHDSNGRKRRCVAVIGSQQLDQPRLVKEGREFITLHQEAGLFQTEHWINRDTTIFTPITDDTSVRVRAFDQITYPCKAASEVFFIGDTEERYAGSVVGRVIHLWKYSEQKGKLFVAKSLLCTEDDIYEELCRILTGF